jgi:hypothetical protein
MSPSFYIYTHINDHLEVKFPLNRKIELFFFHRLQNKNEVFVDKFT